jgi:hypothetical protein
MKMLRKYILGLFQILLLAACSSGKTVSPIPKVLTTTDDGAYPAPLSETIPEIAYEVPSPGVDTGVVIGSVVDHKTNKPLMGYSIYLATIIWMTPGPDYSYGVQENSSPHTITDGQGRFAIGSVQPGKYVVMIWTPFQASVVIDSKTGKEVDVVVDAGKTVDLGKLEGIDPLNLPPR